MSETKPILCPVCGGKSAFMLQNERLTINCEVKRYGFVMCVKCGLQQGETLTENEAIEAWNRRKPMENIVEQLEKLEEHCLEMNDWQGQSALVDAIDIVRNAGKDGAE